MRDIENSHLVINAALSTGLPVWIGFSAMRKTGKKNLLTWSWKNSQSNSDFEELIKSATQLGGNVAGIMHSQVSDTSPALEILCKHWSGPKMAYAETGNIEKPEWNFKEVFSTLEYARKIDNWIKKFDVQIVGGCCGTSPEHIRAISDYCSSTLNK